MYPDGTVGAQTCGVTYGALLIFNYNCILNMLCSVGLSD